MIAVPPGDKWRRRDSGPVVRPYAVTGGRTEPAADEMLDLLTVVVGTGQPAAADDPARLTPEHRKILSLCGQQITVADLAADIALPLGVVRVLLADLILQGAITVVRQRPAGQRTGNDVLQEILNGLRAL
ncbi:MAG TPA: DUF742 domain-containing protein [Trebonia sp.]|nr:DUF742 domain-containing protein [Trebonia sp.]